MSIEPGFLLGTGFGTLALVGVLAYRSLFRIEQGHLGIVTTFGRAEMSNEAQQILRTWAPGLHWKWPWQKVINVSMMEQSLDLSGPEGGITAMAADGTILRLNSRLRYAPVGQELYDFLFAMRHPIEHIKGLFTCLLRNEIANFKPQTSDSDYAQTGSFSVIRSERKLLNQHIKEFTHRKIGGRYGVRFDAVDLTDILPPDELADALNAVFNAQTEANTSYAKAEAECQSRILAAEHGVTIAKDHALATKREILTLAEFIKDLRLKGQLKDYIQRRMAETTLESRAVFFRRTT